MNPFLLAGLMGWVNSFSKYNPPDANDKIISPPQSEESKQSYIKRAEQKRRRKKKH